MGGKRRVNSRERDPAAALSGTPWESIPAAYGGKCDGYQDAPTGAAGFTNWCDALIAQHASDRPNKDCHFFLQSDSGVPDAWAHDMHLIDVSKNAATGACEIEVIDSGRQGLGQGGDVPINQNSQTWSVGAGTPLSISLGPNSSDHASWSTMQPPPTRARFLCCQ